jgi:hypothetical protein
LHVELALAGVLLAIWTFLPHGVPHHAGFVFFAWPLIAFVVRRSRQPREGASASPIAAREDWLGGVRTFTLVVPLLLYVGWARVVGQPPLVTLGSVLFFLGTFITLPSLWAPAERHLAGWGIGFMLGGLAMPAAMPFSGISADAYIGAAIMIGGGWGAIVLARRTLTAPQPG